MMCLKEKKLYWKSLIRNERKETYHRQHHKEWQKFSIARHEQDQYKLGQACCRQDKDLVPTDCAVWHSKNWTNQTEYEEFLRNRRWIEHEDKHGDLIMVRIVRLNRSVAENKLSQREQSQKEQCLIIIDGVAAYKLLIFQMKINKLTKL